MARFVRMKPKARHLIWKLDRRRFVTLCDDGNVILDGRVMTLREATFLLLKESGLPSSVFWEEESIL